MPPANPTFFQVTTLRSALSAPPYNLPTITFSLDDIYLTHADQLRLAASHPHNPLLQHRGQPSTHDIALGKQVFASLKKGLPTKIPAYDKSAFDGQGDRVPEDRWEVVNDVARGQERVKVVIFEGWCVGFRARPVAEIRAAWEDAVKKKEEEEEEAETGEYDGQLGYVKLEDVMAVNDALKEYDAFTDDAEKTHYVYDWRQEQERALIAQRGTGMTPEQVTQFVNGYYPSYELFIPALRNGVFKTSRSDNHPSDRDAVLSGKGKQLRLVVNQQRRVTEVITYE
ncbi:D-glycerate 3-kinase [Emydomyces testavorans]|uniref:D-glycerate 3-kinase n=1 Tax=Emydomyces testavorans TaxID=2070801 RepID=A0AAF0IIY1_9EURO|nr:D-glycerate 3-kinase [Emydomyces testavorans]